MGCVGVGCHLRVGEMCCGRLELGLGFEDGLLPGVLLAFLEVGQPGSFGPFSSPIRSRRASGRGLGSAVGEPLLDICKGSCGAGAVVECHPVRSVGQQAGRAGP